MRCRNYQDAVEQAQAHANRSRAPWFVFSDTSGNWRCEKVGSTGVGDALVVRPTVTDEEG